jgi:hypothetical protein
MAECCGTLHINLKWSTSLPSVRQLTRKCGSLDISQPYGLPRPVTGIALPFFFLTLEQGRLDIKQQIFGSWTDCVYQRIKWWISIHRKVTSWSFTSDANTVNYQLPSIQASRILIQLAKIWEKNYYFCKVIDNWKLNLQCAYVPAATNSTTCYSPSHRSLQ